MMPPEETGAFTTWTPSAANAASKLATNSASRSRIKSLTWVAQSGTPFTVKANNTGAAGATDDRRANVVRDPFSPGGSPDPSNTALTAADLSDFGAKPYELVQPLRLC